MSSDPSKFDDVGHDPEDTSAYKQRPQRTAPKPVRRVSSRYLRNAGLFYVERYSATEQRLRRVLIRRVDKSFQAYGTVDDKGNLSHKEGDRSAFKTIVDDLIQEFVRLGYVDDAKFALGKARRLYRGGNSIRQIRGKLQIDGITSAKIEGVVENVLEEANLSEASIDRKAAWAYARKKRIGPFRSIDEQPDVRAEIRQEMRKRDLGALARRGFGSDIAYAVIDAEDIPEEFETTHGLSFNSLAM